MEHFLFAGYLIFFAWLITKIKFFTKSGLTNSQLVILFLLKVMAGIFYGWIGIYYGQMAQMIDTWAYHVEGLREYEALQNNPLDFFTNLFHTTYDSGYSNFLTTHDSWWNDVKANFLVKMMAVFDVFSFGHYYVNVIFISFITFFGPVAIYRVMQDVFPTKKLPVLLATFLIPSFLYWTSGLHKEGIIFTGIALMVYHFYFGFKENKFPLYRILLIVFGFSIVLLLRNFLIIALISPILAWILCQKIRVSPVIIYSVVSFLFVALFFTAKYIHPKLDFPEATALKQQEFLKLGGGSAVSVNKLEPNFSSFLKNAPEAFSLSIIRPYPSDVRHLLSLAAAMEICFLLLLFIAFLVWRKNGTPISPFLLFCFLFSLGVLMMIGYTVNILGALVRYRSIVLPFLIIPMVAKIDWDRIGQLILGNMTNKNQI